MSIHVGNNNITGVSVGNTPVKQVYMGGAKVWEKVKPTLITNYSASAIISLNCEPNIATTPQSKYVLSNTTPMGVSMYTSKNFSSTDKLEISNFGSLNLYMPPNTSKGKVENYSQTGQGAFFISDIPFMVIHYPPDNIGNVDIYEVYNNTLSFTQKPARELGIVKPKFPINNGFAWRLKGSQVGEELRIIDNKDPNNKLNFGTLWYEPPIQSTPQAIKYDEHILRKTITEFTMLGINIKSNFTNIFLW